MDNSVAGDLAFALDPVSWTRAAIGFDPDPWQIQVLRSNAPHVLMNASRQAGKSQTTALLALHQALYCPGTLALLLSPSLRQSSELFKKVTTAYSAIANPVPSEAESALRLELRNGSRIVSLPGKEETVRGYSGVDLLAIDEAARVSDDLYYAVRPMLAVSGGRMVALSTPFGKRGWWHDVWTHGGDRWQRFEVTAYECPRITSDFLEEERQAMPDPWFRSEYLCQFVDVVGSVFGYDQVMAAISADVQPLFGGVLGG